MPNFIGRANLFWQSKAFKKAAEITYNPQINYCPGNIPNELHSMCLKRYVGIVNLKNFSGLYTKPEEQVLPNRIQDR